MMTIIRPETSADYAAIHDIHTRAFDNQIGVSALVALLRTTGRYDPDLALIAEVDGRVVGHVMFTPIQVYLKGKILKIVNLSPIGIHPDFQKQGIGGKLIMQGHIIAQEKGYDSSILLGHPEYYPRFGYHTKAYGASSVIIKSASLPEINLETSSPTPDDVSALADLHQSNEKNVNLSIVPENSLAEWLSPNPNLPCRVYRYQGELVGYIRGSANDVRLFLAKNDTMARAIAKNLAGDAAEIKLPLHPDSLCASAFETMPSIEPWNAAMICPLHDDSLVHDYLKAIDNGASVGRVIWASVFDIA